MVKNDFLTAITQLCAEKNLSKEVVIDALQTALASAYKRNFGANLDVDVRVQPTSGEFRVYVRKFVAEPVEDEATQMTVAEARRELGREPELGEALEFDRTPRDFGRIAAQTAKQVFMQRAREAERDVVFEEYIDKEDDIISGVVQRVDPRQITIDLGKAEAVLPATEQVPGEHFRPGARIKAYLVQVLRTPRGPQLIASRTHRNLLRRLFELEVPEIFNGTVEIKAIAREAGSRSKVAVAARQPGIDPVGACVGLRGIRIQNIVNELNNEKIDVIEWAADPAVFVAKALSPANVVRVLTDESGENKTATVVVPDRQLSLAIGKEGQNARLAAKLTGWRIDIKSLTVFREEELVRLQEEEIEREAQEALRALETPVYVPEPEPEPVIAVAEEPVVVEEPEVFEEIPLEAVAEVVDVPPVVVPPRAPVVAPPPVPYVEERPVVAPSNKGQIRFAEDIIGDGRGGKRRSPLEEEEEAARAPKKGTGKRQRVYFEDDEEDEYEDILRKIR